MIKLEKLVKSSEITGHCKKLNKITKMPLKIKNGSRSIKLKMNAGR